MRTNFCKYRQPYRFSISSSWLNDKLNFIKYHTDLLYGDGDTYGVFDVQMQSLKPSITAVTSIEDELNNLKSYSNLLKEEG